MTSTSRSASEKPRSPRVSPTREAYRADGAADRHRRAIRPRFPRPARARSGPPATRASRTVVPTFPGAPGTGSVDRVTTDNGDPGADQHRQPAAGPSDSDDMSAMAEPGPDPATADDPWRRPPAGSETAGRVGSGLPTAPPTAGGPPRYLGPPPTQPPPPGWRPPLIIQPTAPRQLPGQDLDRLDREERGARNLTLGVSMVAGAVVLVMSCLLCARLFPF